MVNFKRAIAAVIVCFKPHVLLTLCILLVIAHSIIIAVQKGAANSWRVSSQRDLTLAMTTLVLVVALIWAAFFIFIVRFELRNELDTLLTLFQCSKRGLRLLGVIGFHVALLATVSLVVSATVERSLAVPSNSKAAGNASTVMYGRLKGFRLDIVIDDEAAGARTASSLRHGELADVKPGEPSPSPPAGSSTIGLVDRRYLLAVYKIWLTAIVYAFLYLIIENVVMFYADMPLIEFVHISFLTMVTKLTGIDLSDYPAGEMLFNPLIRHRIR